MVLRSDAPKGKASNSVREEFQIVGNKSWDLRYYPAGGDKEVGIAVVGQGLVTLVQALSKGPSTIILNLCLHHSARWGSIHSKP